MLFNFTTSSLFFYTHNACSVIEDLKVKEKTMRQPSTREFLDLEMRDLCRWDIPVSSKREGFPILALQGSTSVWIDDVPGDFSLTFIWCQRVSSAASEKQCYQQSKTAAWSA